MNTTETINQIGNPMGSFTVQPLVEFTDIYNKDGFCVSRSLEGIMPSSAANYGTFFIAPIKCEVVRIDVIWETAGSSSTLNIERLQGTEAKDAGDELLAADLSTAGTAKTVNTTALIATRATRVLSVGNRLGLKDGGTLTSLADLTITISLIPIGQGHYRNI